MFKHSITASTLALAALVALSAPVLASGAHEGGHGEMAAGKPGKPGKASAVDRTIEISMKENEDGQMLFSPSEIKAKKGETVRLVIKNTGETDHEFVLDTPKEIVEHKALMEKFPEMEHDDPNSLRLAPGATGEIVWTFSNAGSFEFACLIPGHYEAGMHGDVKVSS
ncbi:copper oxidase [bacterium]|nr:MAG: copper oxidase [bacterium]